MLLTQISTSAASFHDRATRMPNATTLAALTTVVVSQDSREMDAHAAVCSRNASFFLILRQFRPDDEDAASHLTCPLILIAVFVSVLGISATNFSASASLPLLAKNENIAVLYKKLSIRVMLCSVEHFVKVHGYQLTSC